MRWHSYADLEPYSRSMSPPMLGASHYRRSVMLADPGRIALGVAHKPSPLVAAETNAKACPYKQCAEPAVPPDTPVLEVIEALSGFWRRIQFAGSGTAILNA